jgi:6-pyruvoyltetrahydropterin/6-carboxytetrahydropterin synthase
MNGTFTLKKRFTFEAAHYLPHHDGKCRRLHGHSWVGWAELGGTELQTAGPQTGMVMDFDCVSTFVKPMVEEYLDHYCLNESLAIESPTSEAIAVWVFGHLKAKGLPLTAVTIEETCTSVCTYRE